MIELPQASNGEEDNMNNFNQDYLNMSLEEIKIAEKNLHELLNDKLRNMKIDDELEMVYQELETIIKEKQRREQENV